MTICPASRRQMESILADAYVSCRADFERDDLPSPTTPWKGSAGYKKLTLLASSYAALAGFCELPWPFSSFVLMCWSLPWAKIRRLRRESERRVMKKEKTLRVARYLIPLKFLTASWSHIVSIIFDMKFGRVYDQPDLESLCTLTLSFVESRCSYVSPTDAGWSKVMFFYLAIGCIQSLALVMT